MKYPSPKAGEWVTPVMRGYKMSCCDCGLVHRMNFAAIKPSRKRKGVFSYRVIKGRIAFQAFRDNRATAGVRNGKYRRGEIKRGNEQ